MMSREGRGGDAEVRVGKYGNQARLSGDEIL